MACAPQVVSAVKGARGKAEPAADGDRGEGAQGRVTRAVVMTRFRSLFLLLSCRARRYFIFISSVCLEHTVDSLMA